MLFFLTLGVILQTIVFKLGYLVTDLGGPVLSPCNLASDNAMRLSVAMSKTSFALTLLRLTGTCGWPRPVILVSTFVVGALAVAHCVLVWKATCGASNTWTFQPCWSSDGGLYMNLIGSVIAAATDFIFTGIPIVVMWNLQLRRREKIGVGVAVALGSFAGIISIVKAQKSYEVISIVGPEFGQRLAVLSMMVHAEPNAAIIATTIPVLRVLFIDLIKTTRSKRSRSDNDPSSGWDPTTGRSGHGLASTRVTAKPVGRDNDSEKSILEDDMRNAGGIVTTRQITVDYGKNDHSDKSREAADGYEMGRMLSGPYSRVP